MSISGIKFQQFQPWQIEDGLELCRIAGWNQLRGDWQRLFDLNPQGCFSATVAGKTIGTATSTRFGTELAWIGMMLVHPDYRRRGLASRFIRLCQSHLRCKGIPCTRLDATPTGAKVYEKLGFVPEWEIQRWQRALPTADNGSSVTENFLKEQHLELDRVAFGANREALLTKLQADSEVAYTDRAFGLLRKGYLADYLGPVVSANSREAAEVISSLCAGSKGCIFWDIPLPNATAVELANSLGFEPCRSLLRMRWGDCVNRPNVDFQYAIAGPSTG